MRAELAGPGRASGGVVARGGRVAAAAALVLATVLGSAAVAVAAPPRAAAPVPAATQAAPSTGAATTPGTLQNPQPPVVGRPDDPPGGVTLETMSDAPDGAVRIDGRAVPNVTDLDNTFIVVIDRTNRAVVESGTVQRDDGIGQLGEIVSKWSQNGRYLVVISGRRGVGGFPQLAALSTVAQTIGGTPFAPETDAYTSLLEQRRFTLVGVAGGQAGGAWQVFDRGGPGETGGNLRGFLRVNPATNLYDVVVPDTATFDTSAPGSGPGQNTIVVRRSPADESRFEARLPDGAVDGFQVLVLDARTLRFVSNQAFATNGPGDVAAQQDRFERGLREATNATAESSRPLVLLQSIGHPRGASPSWSRGPREQNEGADRVVERLGGNPLAFDALDASSDYSLVGVAPTNGVRVDTTAEAGVKLGKAGPLSGVLSRTRDLSFAVTSSGPTGGVNTELVDIANQQPSAFPAFTSPGQQAAETFVGTSLRLCTDDATSCPVRPTYYQQSTRDWGILLTELINLAAPASPQGFTSDDLAAVKAVLRPEFTAVGELIRYFSKLQEPFTLTQSRSPVDLAVLGNALYNDAQGTPSDSTTPKLLGLLSKAALLGTFAGPPVSAVASGISATLGLTAYLMTRAGDAQLATNAGLARGVTVRSLDLAQTAQDRLASASASTTAVAQLFLGDHDKLLAAQKRLSAPAWNLPASTQPAVDGLRQASQQWFAETLVPAVYPRLNRSTPGYSPNTVTCTKYRVFEILPYQVSPWGSQPANAQESFTEGFNGDGSRQTASYFFSRVGTDDASPSQALADKLFNGPGSGGIGLNRLDFLSARVFGPVRLVNHRAPCDQLGGVSALPGVQVGATPNAGVGVAGTVLFATVTTDDPSGAVAFYDGTSPITGCGARRLLAGGVATCVTTFATAGPHEVTAVYGDGSGDDPLSGSTTVSVSGSPDPLQLAFGQLFAFLSRFGLFGL